MAVSTFVRSRSTWAMYLALALFAYLETVVGPSVPFIREKLGLGFTVTSLHFSAFAGGAIVVGFTSDRFVDRFGRRRLLWGGLSGMAIGAGMLAVGPTVPVTVAGALTMGLLGSLALVSNQAALADLHGAQRTVALAESNVAASSAAVLAPLVVGVASGTALGWQTGLLLGMPVLAVVALVFGQAVIPPAPARPRATAGDRDRALPRTYWVLWTVLLLSGSIEWCIVYWGADYLVDHAALTKSSAATAMTLFFAAMAIGRLVGSRVARHRPAVDVLLGALAIAALGFPLFWLASAPTLALVGLFVAGLGVANFYPMTLGAATGAAADQVDRATGRLAICGGLSLLIAPFALGAISDAAGMQVGLGLVPPLLAASAIATLVARRAAV